MSSVKQLICAVPGREQNAASYLDAAERRPIPSRVALAVPFLKVAYDACSDNKRFPVYEKTLTTLAPALSTSVSGP